jgi:hypothetical protein
MARLSICGVLAAVVLTACGARSSTVRGPDGEDAHVISCNAAAACYEKAAQVCDGRYVIRESHGFPTTVAESLNNHVEILVSCATDAPASADSASASAETSSDRDDVRVCQAASKFRTDFGLYWASTSGGVLLDEPPAPRDFVVTCQSMPETVQRCMHDKYRSAHQQACNALLVRLDVASRTRIDALFLQVGAEPVPRSTVPGGTSL